MKSLSKFNIAILFVSTCIALTACNSGGGGGGGGGGNQPTPTPTYQKLYSFTDGTDGATPSAGLIQGSDGNFYGTTRNGGTNGDGTVFKITPQGVKTTLYSFAGGNDGASPLSVLFLDKDGDGNFYGTTYLGGANKLGTVFKITPQGKETVLYNFAGGNDGAKPQAALIILSDGNFYGTTYQGGTSNLGTIFKITPQGKETVLYSFAGGTTDGASPYGKLLLDSDGNLYGTTYLGVNGIGTIGIGTVFKVTPAGAETILYNFIPDNYIDGAYPTVGLIQGRDGNLYGTTDGNGPLGYGFGTVFQITPKGVKSTLYTFTGGNDGATPSAVLLQGKGSDSNLYGTTLNGGYGGVGTVFKLTLKGIKTILYDFTGENDGAAPSGGLIQGSDGNLYGVTQGGGGKSAGTVFKITPPGN